MKRLLLFLMGLPVFGATLATFDVSDYVGDLTLQQQRVCFPYSGGIVKPATHRVRLNGADVAWQQATDGSICVLQPKRHGSLLLQLDEHRTGVYINAETCDNHGSFSFIHGASGTAASAWPAGTRISIQKAGTGVVPSPLVAGTLYTAYGTCSNPYNSPDLVWANTAGSPITLTSRGTDPFRVYVWGGARNGAGMWLRANDYVDGIPVRFRVYESDGALSTPLSASTTYYFDMTGANAANVYSDSALQNQVTLTTDTTGVMEVIPTYLYTLEDVASSMPALTNPVSVALVGDNIEVTNGLTGFRVPTVAANSALNRAPIQGIRLLSGTWTGSAGPNLLYREAGPPGGGSPSWPPTTSLWGATAYRVMYLEKGPLVTKIRVEYDFDRPDYTGSESDNSGHWVTELTLDAGAKHIKVFDDTDMFAGYFLRTDQQVTANTLRIRAGGDSTQDATESWDNGDTATIGTYGLYDGTTKSNSNYAYIYNSAGAADSDVLGVFKGWMGSHYKSRNSQKGVLAKAASCTWFGGAACIYISSGALIGTSSIERVKVTYGIHVDRKDSIPAGVTTTEVGPIGQVANEQANQLSLSRLVSGQFKTDLATPAGGWYYPYQTAAYGAAILNEVRTNTTFYNAMYAQYNVNYKLSKPFVEAARHSGTDAHANDIVLLEAVLRLRGWMSIFRHCGSLVKNCVPFNQLPRSSYEGGFDIQPAVTGALSVLTSGTANTAQASLAKTILGMVGGILWDPDFTPCGLVDTGDNCGVRNQLVQMMNYRTASGNVLNTSPWYATPTLPDGGNLLSNSLEPRAHKHSNPGGNIDLSADPSTGVCRNSTAYLPTYMSSGSIAANSFLAAGGVFSTQNTSRWQKAANFYLSNLTPPDPRFSAAGKRCMVAAAGDASTYVGDETFSILSRIGASTGLKWAYGQMDSLVIDFFAPTTTLADDLTTGVDPAPGSSTWPTSHSTLRSGWGTANENFIRFTVAPGYTGLYDDHMHPSEQMAPVIHALKAPLSLVTDSLYSPTINDRRWKNTIAMESELPQAWNADSQNEAQLTTKFGDALDAGYFAGAKVSWAAATNARSGGPTWRREVRLINFNASYPIIQILDGHTGANSTASKVYYYNQMASGSVTWPDTTTCAPTVRVWTSLPSANCSADLTTDALNRIRFVGQGWTWNAGGIIDWDMYVLPSGATPAVNIGHIKMPFQNNGAQAAYGSGHGISQYMVRIKTAGATQNVIYLPRAKANPAPDSVVLNSGVVTITRGSDVQTISADAATYNSGAGTTALVTFNTVSATHDSMTISGGPAECVKTATEITCKLSGTSVARRTITIPSGFRNPDKPLETNGSGEYYVYHVGGVQPDTYTVVFSATPGTYKTVTAGPITPPSGATKVRMMFGSTTEYLLGKSCSPNCTLSVQTTTGSKSVRLDYLDANDAPVFPGQDRTITVN